MSFAEFAASAVRDPAPPEFLGSALQGLWHDRRGDWSSAHACVQADPGADAAWVHAYLHRKEGDLANAGYWYRKAGRPAPAEDLTLRIEWEQIAGALLGGAAAAGGD